MLSGLYSAVTRLVTSNPGGASDDDEPAPLNYPSSDKSPSKDPTSYPDSYSFSPDPSATKRVEPQNIKIVQGEVTQLLSSGYGLIDNNIVFTYDDVVGKERPRVGTMVQVEAHREHSGAGWKAKKVSLSLDWNEDPNKADPIEVQTIVGTISKVEHRVGAGFINDTISFHQDDVAHGFKPYKGDWIEAELHSDPDTQQDIAKNVRPLRHREFHGVVTHAYPGYGYIDNKIYFMFSNCENGYRPKRGEEVVGKAIESDQSKGRWRAVQVSEKKVLRRQHRAMESPLQTNRMQELEKNKLGIVISSNNYLGSMIIDDTKTIKVSIKNVGSMDHTLRSCEACSLSAQVSVKIYKNQINASPLNERSSQEDNEEYLLLPTAVPEMSSMTAVLSITASQLGRNSFPVIFDFGEFQIGRKLTMTVEDPSVLALTPSSISPRTSGGNRRDRLKGMYTQSKCNEGWVVPGRRIARTFDVNVPVKLPMFQTPRELEQAVLQGEDVTLSYPELNQGLNMDNYSVRFSALLHLEEIQMQIDMRQFDLERVSMKPRCGEYLSLAVPGLAEGRPSVMVGDKIVLYKPDANKYSPKYEGIVHEVHGEDVMLKFNEIFQDAYQAEEYNVEFTFSRTPIRRCHQATEFGKVLGKQVLFPNKVEARPPQVNITYRTLSPSNVSRPRIPKNLPRLKSPSPKFNAHKSPYESPTNKQLLRVRSVDGTGNTGPSSSPPKTPDNAKFVLPKISSSEKGTATNVMQAKMGDGRLVANFFNPKLNARQRSAVVRILHGEGRPTPYVLFGPPGTGKTVTVVEAILQIHHHMPSSRILACTPSNSAADLLVERLHLSGIVKPHELIRLNSFRRSEDGIPDIIRQYCRDGEELEKIAHHRMLVCTCSTAGSFYQLGLKAGHFTHVFVDEAGQATEPECMVPIGLAVGAEGQIILAGDPMQLGPMLNSDIAKEYGLDLSLLERLTKRPLYRRDNKKFRDHGNYDPLLVTKLVDNYRSHPVLLKLPSETFYHGELQPQADPKIINCMCHWESLPNSNNCPLIFHGIKGEDMREGNSPSWFNPMEIVQVVKYLKGLLAMSEPRFKTSDIGVITPYRKQVEKIRMMMAMVDIHDVKVGSVEEFQGQERLAMIISTVRSAEELVGFDVRHHLGFIQNPKRFNVSITRAQAVQIIVGNPHILAKDRYWRALLRYCIQQNAYVGCDLPDMSDDDVIEEGDLDRTLEEPDLDKTLEDTLDNSDIQLQDDTPVKDKPSITDTSGICTKLEFTDEDDAKQKSDDREVQDNVAQVEHTSSNVQLKMGHRFTEAESSSQSEPVDARIPELKATNSNQYPEEPVLKNDHVADHQETCSLDISAEPFLDIGHPSQRLEGGKAENQQTCQSHHFVESKLRSEHAAEQLAGVPRDMSVGTDSEMPPLEINEDNVCATSNEQPTVQGVVLTACKTSNSTSVSKNDKSSPTESSDSGIGSEPVEIVIIGPPSNDNALSDQFRKLRTLSEDNLADKNSKSVPETNSNADGQYNPVKDALVKIANVSSGSAPNVKYNSKHDALREHQQSSNTNQEENGVKHNDLRVVEDAIARHAKTSPAAGYVIPDVDEQKRDTVIKTLYHGVSATMSQLVDADTTIKQDGHVSGVQNENQKGCDTIPDVVADISSQTPTPSETSEPSVHLSDDSGPEDFQDYDPSSSRSSSDPSSHDEKEKHREWWMEHQRVHTNKQSGRRQQRAHRPVRAMAFGRGSPHPSRDSPQHPTRGGAYSARGSPDPSRGSHHNSRGSSHPSRDYPHTSSGGSHTKDSSHPSRGSSHSSRGSSHPSRSRGSSRDKPSNTVRDYYVGLGRGRGRPMQMAANMEDCSDRNAFRSNRSFSYGRGQIYHD